MALLQLKDIGKIYVSEGNVAVGEERQVGELAERNFVREQVAAFRLPMPSVRHVAKGKIDLVNSFLIMQDPLYKVGSGTHLVANSEFHISPSPFG